MVVLIHKMHTTVLDDSDLVGADAINASVGVLLAFCGVFLHV